MPLSSIVLIEARNWFMGMEAGLDAGNWKLEAGELLTGHIVFVQDEKPVVIACPSPGSRIEHPGSVFVFFQNPVSSIQLSQLSELSKLSELY